MLGLLVMAGGLGRGGEGFGSTVGISGIIRFVLFEKSLNYEEQRGASIKEELQVSSRVWVGYVELVC